MFFSFPPILLSSFMLMFLHANWNISYQDMSMTCTTISLYFRILLFLHTNCNISSNLGTISCYRLTAAPQLLGHVLLVPNLHLHYIAGHVLILLPYLAVLLHAPAH